MSNDIVEGVFAIHKPQGITSAEVIREVQAAFKPSKLFRPWFERYNQERQESIRANGRKTRRDKLPPNVKMGHGGTLDPMATGVLILGVGSGTKKLNNFLKCTKSYDTVVLFGQSTDTYDVLGKTVARKSFDHITREKVETALAQYRGDIMQRPPIYSALKMQGKKLYEYAREGLEVPAEIAERPVTVERLELVEWYEGGTHQHHWPAEEAEPTEKAIAAILPDIDAGQKREREADGESEDPRKKTKRSNDDWAYKKDKMRAEKPSRIEMPDNSGREPCPAPACRLKMTVTSGFYVRSLCHDLGAAVDSLGTMASLVRTRQGEYELGKNVLEYADLEKGEEVWSPIVKQLLEVEPSLPDIPSAT